jgi:hypothetical protein
MHVVRDASEGEGTGQRPPAPSITDASINQQSTDDAEADDIDVTNTLALRLEDEYMSKISRIKGPENIYWHVAANWWNEKIFSEVWVPHYPEVRQSLIEDLWNHYLWRHLADKGLQTSDIPRFARLTFAAMVKYCQDKERERLERERLRLVQDGIVFSRDRRTSRKPKWLVEGILVAGQPAIIGGPEKTLKTSIGVDLAVSLATKTPFLGRFQVPRRRGVLFLSAESGQDAIYHTAWRVVRARGLHELPKRIVWGFKAVQLDRKSGLEKLQRWFGKLSVDVVVLDPLYLLLGSGEGFNAADLYQVGGVLTKVSQACLEEGVTPILVHHANRRLRVGRMMRLKDLAFAGIPEFARQWLLLNRRREYEDDGKHRLTLQVGGSVGHSSGWDVDVDEGASGADNLRHEWIVTSSPHKAAKKADPTGVTKDAVPDAGEKAQALQERLLTALNKVLDVGGEGAAKVTANTTSGERAAKYAAVQAEAGLNRAHMETAVRSLMGRRITVEERKGKNGKPLRLILPLSHPTAKVGS